MADDINSSASFGQNKDNDEELPIIVAQRFLNIFRQLHIFSDERREAFNKMLLELPKEVKNIFQSLPGGTPLQEYMEDLEQKSKGLEPVAHHEHKKNGNILQDAMESQHHVLNGGGNVISGDFAKVLASSLAQSNAEIIKELQNARPVAVGDGTINFDGPMKLVADESFTHIISKALAEAIENSEKKRLEDNKMIAQSFMELQENLTKLIEQNNGQIKFAATGEKGEIVPVKGIVDDLVKAQSEFLKETTKNQKDELSSIISTAIKESQKVSTQALIDSFKQINADGAPAPITYAATSPKGNVQSMESVEQALKAQGKEFSSIISMALKESQKNSAQTIIETLENLKKDSSFGGSQNNLKVEEIMRMQANLFRDIARAQNQEFSALISSALKESQKQSTEAIIAALSKLQNRPVQTVAVPVPAATFVSPSAATPVIKEDIEKKQDITETNSPADEIKQEQQAVVQTPLIDKYLDNEDKEDNDSMNSVENELSSETEDDLPKKKKKKKKKKNKGVADISSEMASGAQEQQTAETNRDSGNTLNKEKQQSAEEKAPVSDKEKLSETTNSEIKEKVAPKADVSVADEKEKTPPQAPLKNEEKITSNIEVPEATPAPAKPQTSMLEKLMTISTAFSSVEDIKDNDEEDWGWGSSLPSQSNQKQDEERYTDFTNANPSFAYDDDSSANGTDEEGQDWEWEYEEVPEDAEMSGEEGQDWEWEYEEVPEDADVSGEEGQDWEWEYEEVPADSQTIELADENQFDYADTENSDSSLQDLQFAPEEEKNYDYDYDYGYQENQTDGSNLYTPEEFAQTSEIVLNELPQLTLLGLEDENFRDPYIENNDNIG